MENKLIDLVKETLQDSSKLPILENICELCEQFRFFYTLDEMIEALYSWLHEKYNVEDMAFSLFEMDKNMNCVIFSKGEISNKYMPFYFIIDTQTETKATIVFTAKDEKHHELLSTHRKYLDALFFQITPTIENILLKKIHLENSSIDSITNVYTRQYLLEYLNKKINLFQESSDKIKFLMISIDRFKAVIEEFDYDVGDQVLVELAKVIHGTIKNHDIVARLTGNTFVVALLHRKDIDEAISVAQKIIDTFAKTDIIVNEDTNQILRKTVCIGIASFPHDGEDIETVIKNADKFLDEAKNKGRSQYAVYCSQEEHSIELF